MPADRLLDRLRLLVQEALARRDRPVSDERRRGVAIVLSVLVAFVLWFTVSMREHYAVVVEMPMAVRGLPEGRALSRMPPQRARVTLQGEGWELLKLQRRPPTLYVSAANAQVDLVAAASESGDLPAGVSVQSVAPASIELELEPEIAKTVPVRPRTRIETAQLYDLLGPPQVSPDSVRLRGARSILNTIHAWPTAVLAREDVRGTFTTAIALSDTLAGLVRKSLDQVQVTVPAALFTEATRPLAVRTEGAPPGVDPVRFLPARVTVTYRIPVDEYERSLSTPDFYAFVPYAVVVNDTTGSVQPVLHFPAELTVRDARFEPRRLRYRLRVD